MYLVDVELTWKLDPCRVSFCPCWTMRCFLTVLYAGSPGQGETQCVRVPPLTTVPCSHESTQTHGVKKKKTHKDARNENMSELSITHHRAKGPRPKYLQECNFPLGFQSLLALKCNFLLILFLYSDFSSSFMLITQTLHQTPSIFDISQLAGYLLSNTQCEGNILFIVLLFPTSHCSWKQASRWQISW